MKMLLNVQICGLPCRCLSTVSLLFIGMLGCNCLLLAVDTSDVLLHVDSVSSESVVDALIVSGCELMVLIVRELETCSVTGSSCVMVVVLIAVV